LSRLLGYKYDGDELDFTPADRRNILTVLFDAPQIPAGIQSFQWIPLEWDWNLEKIHRNETESSGMEPESTGMGPESTGMAGIHRNDRIPQE